MPRGKSHKSEESRARLLKAAAREFADRGFHDARISRIVAEAGLAQGAFYLYFESKEALFDQLVSAFVTRFRELGNGGMSVTPLHGADAVVAQARRNLEEFFAFLAEDPALTRLALLQSQTGATLLEEVRGMVLQNLKANQKAGHLRADLPVEVAADVMVGALHRLAMRMLQDEQPDLPRLAAEAADVLMHGMLAGQ